MSAILFSAWQATTHAWHPEHLSRSMTIPQRGMLHSLNVKFQKAVEKVLDPLFLLFGGLRLCHLILI
jgi:hypothetical protein